MPVDHQSLREVVADALRQLIIDGELAPGERLTEESLAKRLGVSRNPIREAIHALEAVGLVEVVPRRGAYVAAVDIDDIRLIEEVRVTMDRWIVQAAALRHDNDDLATIDECLSVGRAASEASDQVGAAAQHRAFHLAIEAATKNPYVTMTLDPLRDRVELVYSILAHQRGPVGWDAHQAIRDAIARREVELATRLMEEHHQDAVTALRHRTDAR